MSDDTTNQQILDAIVIGAGYGGLYQLLTLRQLGMRVRAFEAGSGVGGTWYWNRYPGARTDGPSHVYQYLFSDELLQEWDWSERYVGQAESERYLNHVADRFDLRKDITFDARVTSAIWNEGSRTWTVSTASGETVQATFLITALGPLSTPLVPPFEGHERFRGRIVHTSRWPRGGIDLKGERVGVIGTGASGVQVIQTIASEVRHLTVFQRTANYAVPMTNPRFTEPIAKRFAHAIRRSGRRCGATSLASTRRARPGRTSASRPRSGVRSWSGSGPMDRSRSGSLVSTRSSSIPP